MAKVERDEVREYRKSDGSDCGCLRTRRTGDGLGFITQRIVSVFHSKHSALTERRNSPLKHGDTVEIIDITRSEEECLHEMLVKSGGWIVELAVRELNWKPDSSDEQSQEGIADWHYWVGEATSLAMECRVAHRDLFDPLTSQMA